MNMWTLRHALTGAFIGVMTTACGQSADLSARPTSSPPNALGEAGDTVNAQTRVIEGEFSDDDNSAECVTLRAKIFKDRSTVKLTSEWRAVHDSSEYHALQEARGHWAGAGCNRASNTPQGACTELSSTVSSHGDELASTPQWAALVGTSSFSDLFTDWGKATNLHCVKF